jgi:DNA mismatch repair protein MutS
LFSTHYHELTKLGDDLERLQNVHVGAMEEEGRIVFLHKVLEGAADESYGIHVAKLADLPDEVIERAGVILTELEKGMEAVPETEKRQAVPVGSKSGEDSGQLSFFVRNGRNPERNPRNKQEDRAVRALKAIDLLSLTPIEAMNKLYDLQKMLEKKG